MGKYTEDAKELLQYVGGKENVGAVAHCMTRMRFVLNDPSKADIGKIEGMKVVKGTFTQSGQFQVIIGNTVSEFYNDFTEVSGISGIGLMIGISLKTKKAGDVAKAALENGLLVLTAKEKVRLLPPLTITYEEIDEGINILAEIMK